MARLRILSEDDFDKLYKIPKLNNEERQFVFVIRCVTSQIKLPNSCHFILPVFRFR